MIDPKSLEFLKLFGAIGWVIVIISPFIWRMIFNYIDKREETSKFGRLKIEIICSHAYELCKNGKLSFEDFSRMSLEELVDKLDE